MQVVPKFEGTAIVGLSILPDDAAEAAMLRAFMAMGTHGLYEKGETVLRAEMVQGEHDALGVKVQPLASNGQPATVAFVQPFGVIFPGDREHAAQLIKTYHIHNDIVVADANEHESYMLIPWSERGKGLVSFAMTNGFVSMLERVKSEARAAANSAVLQSVTKSAPTVG
jgi:hypothetical protein